MPKKGLGHLEKKGHQIIKENKNGWHYTGDIGKIDEEGFLYIVDRKKDIIITGGFNVYSIEIEQTIALLDGVREVACFGIPDEKWGEAVHANITLSKESNLSEEEIINYCKEALGSVKAPKSVTFLHDFPRNNNGKVLKRKMRAPFWDGYERKV